MSKRPGLLSMIWKQLTKKNERYEEKIVGKDIYGNLFFESNQRNFRGQPTRFHMPYGAKDVLNKISPEWDAWLRYRRMDPPSEDEVMKNVKLSQLKKKNAAEKNQQLIDRHTEILFRRREAEARNKFNEFNTSYPKYSNVETNPGQNESSSKNDKK